MSWPTHDDSQKVAKFDIFWLFYHIFLCLMHPHATLLEMMFFFPKIHLSPSQAFDLFKLVDSSEIMNEDIG